MILRFKCPICGQPHSLYVSTQLLQGIPIETRCPLMHEHFSIRLKIEFNIPMTFEKSDIQAAEEEAQLAEYQWRTEEELYFNKRKKTDKMEV